MPPTPAWSTLKKYILLSRLCDNIRICIFHVAETSSVGPSSPWCFPIETRLLHLFFAVSPSTGICVWACILLVLLSELLLQLNHNLGSEKIKFYLYGFSLVQ